MQIDSFLDWRSTRKEEHTRSESGEFTLVISSRRNNDLY